MSSLISAHDGVLLDLDGTVYRGDSILDVAVDAVAALRGAGVPLAFVTNNAARSPSEVAERLTRLGVTASPDDVVTSAQAAARILADGLDDAAPVLVVGTDALTDEVRGAGLRPVARAEDKPAAVVQGHSPDTGWAHLAEACLAIRDGAWWLACNNDATLPSERGLLPGNGAMVAALHAATERHPDVAGKPARHLVDEVIRRLGVRHPLVVGDRVESDVAAATAAGLEALLVLSGVSDAAGVLAAPAAARPGYLGRDLRDLQADPDELAVASRPGWHAEVVDGRLVLHGGRATADNPVDALRTLCAVWWERNTGVPEVRAGDERAERALAALGLAAP